MRITAKQFFYAMIIFVLLGFGGIVGAFYWGDGQLASRGLILSNLQTDRDIASEKVIALQSAKKSAENKDEAIALLEKLLPETKSQETLIADILFTATQEAGIPGDKISTIAFSSSTEPSDLSGTEAFKEVPGVLSYPFTMSVSDISYATLLKLLSEIETNGRLVQIDDIQINPSKVDEGQITSVTLTMKAFLRP